MTSWECLHILNDFGFNSQGVNFWIFYLFLIIFRFNSFNLLQNIFILILIIYSKVGFIILTIKGVRGFGGLEMLVRCQLILLSVCAFMYCIYDGYAYLRD